ncbi:hypothetical protein PPEP_b0598 [Pseudoalteromonas peptidolytica F12-50-A1]|uniref:Uncharacterized protein n=1 Tax=Pseudoalteromonas peptidolytica F12-50-A1 TaxID=1315280 RepID=A0A8I0MZG7_9GAMM|nr:hypothetical protein [Pseudoalteromonas peptidolytica F12-50-A1]
MPKRRLLCLSINELFKQQIYYKGNIMLNTLTALHHHHHHTG